MTSTDLAARRTLPDGMAHLLPRYPRVGWDAHERHGPMTRRWLAMHDDLRGSGGELLRLATAFRDNPEEASVFYREFRPLAIHHYQHLEGHHQIEDTVLFPRFRRLDTQMQGGFNLLESDHEVIHESLVRWGAGIDRLLKSLPLGGDAMRFALDAHLTDADHLGGLIERHLDDEEDVVIPSLLHHGEGGLI
jgi:hemerythrin-like domain-containing protein